LLPHDARTSVPDDRDRTSDGHAHAAWAKRSPQERVRHPPGVM